MDRKLLYAGEFKAVKPPSPEFIMSIAGYASTKDVDRMNDIVEPSAFDSTMADYMKFPVILVNHNWYDDPVGKATSYKIDEKGLYIEASIVDTERGRTIKALIEAGLLKSFSIGFNIKKWESSADEDEPFRIVEVELIEISIVSSPANMEALIEAAESKGIQVKSLIDPREGRGSKGVTIMEPTEVKKIVDDSLAPVGDTIKEQSSTVAELGDKVANMSQVISELKQAAGDGKKTSGELRDLVDKATGDFTKAFTEMQEALKALRSRRIIHPAYDITGDNLKSMLMREPNEMKQNIPHDETVSRVLALQRKNDNVVFIDSLLECASRNDGGSYHTQPRKQRVKSLNIWQDFNEFRKAMDSTTATEGDEYVPTGLSGTLVERVRLELKVASLFEEIVMPTNPFNIGVELGDTDATLAGETTAKVSAFTTDDQTPATANLTISAKKAKSSIQVSMELTEDAAFAIMPLVLNRAVRGIARVIDKAIINGDDSSGTHLDSGYTVAATDFRKAFDGLRYHWITTINSGTVGSVVGKDLGTFSAATMRQIRGQGGKYFLYPSDTAWLMSVKTYLMRILSDLDQVQTLDKYGPQATILTGELAKHDGVPLVVIEFIDETQDAAGIYSAAGYTRSSMLLVNRSQWLRGIKRGMETAVERDFDNDVWKVFAYERMGFIPLLTPSSTDVIINGGYNVDVAS